MKQNETTYCAYYYLFFYNNYYVNILGHHGNGVYYIGTDLQSGDFYIVKEYVLPLITEQETIELLHDIQAAADLKNNNLAAIKNIKHEVCNDKCIFYILQEFDFSKLHSYNIMYFYFILLI